MPRIRCHYIDCIFTDDGYCSAAAVEIDPDTSCVTFTLPEGAAAGFMAEELAQELVKNGHKVLIIAGWPSYPDGYLFKGWNSIQWKTPGFEKCEKEIRAVLDEKIRNKEKANA